MIIERYLLREILLNFGAVLAVILLIFGGHHFVRFMEGAASGAIPTNYIFQLLFVFILSQFMLLVPGAMFVAFLISLGRLYRDLEMTALLACGVGLASLLRPLVWFAFIVSLVVAGLSVWVAPWAERASYELKQEAKLVAAFNAFVPGQFHPIGKNKGVFYLQGAESEDSGYESVFVFLEAKRGMEVFSAQTGERVQNAEGEFLVLENGSLLQRPASDDSWAMLEYRQAQIRLQQSDQALGDMKTREKPLLELFQGAQRADMAELFWRFSIPVACFLLLMLAVFLSRSDPRQGRFGKLFLAILLYIFYIYGMIMAKNWLRSDDMPMLFGMLWVHIIFVVMIFFIARQQLTFRRGSRQV